MLARIDFAMPQRIIPLCIVQGVKPHELIAALMDREGIGPLPLAKRLRKPELQPQIHRFISGAVASPKASTALPLADYFNLPLEAIYDEQVATDIAKQRGIEALPPKPAKKRGDSKAPPVFAKQIAAWLANFPPEERDQAVKNLRAALSNFSQADITAAAANVDALTNVVILPNNGGNPLEGGLRKTGAQKGREAKRKDDEK